MRRAQRLGLAALAVLAAACSTTDGGEGGAGKDSREGTLGLCQVWAAIDGLDEPAIGVGDQVDDWVRDTRTHLADLDPEADVAEEPVPDEVLSAVESLDAELETLRRSLDEAGDRAAIATFARGGSTSAGDVIATFARSRC
jgi:hypothetical protein